MNEAKKHSILIVDDENSNIMTLSHILNPDYAVMAAKNGANAIKAAQKHLPDVILLDIIMPDMDGYAVIAALKESEKTMNIPVIFITGLSDADDEEKGLNLGAVDYITKPFSPALVKIRVLNQIKLIEQFSSNEYDIMKYKLSNDALNIALWDMDVVSLDPVNPGNTFTWSPEFRSMLGFSGLDDFPDVLHSWSDRLHPEDKDRTLGAFAAHLNDYEGNTPFDIEYRLMLKNGEYRSFHALGTTRRDNAGVPIRVAGALMDITDKKRMEREIDEYIEKIKADAHWYKSILDAIPLPVSVTDADTNWTFVNKAMEDFLGTKLEDMLGKPCSNCNSEICNTEDCGIARAKRGLNQTFFSRGDSSYQMNVEMLRDMADETAGFIEVVQDITKIQQLAKQRAEMEITSKAKSAFLANMSHEIRTPMNAIWGITEILMQSNTLPEKAMEGLRKIHNSCDLLLGIINDILDFSKIEAGKLDILPAEYHVAGMINDSIHLNMMRLGDKPIEFEVEVDENIPLKLVGDELRIKQILNNLLSNAFKYTEAGNVTLSAASEADTEERATLVLSVRDTGQGMTEEQVGRLFDEYSRFNEEANRTIEGTGLGLNITRRLIDLMNGDIRVESAPGEGSLFTVRLPQGKVDSEVLGSELAESLRQFRMSHALGRETSQIVREPMPYGSILVVDDVETNLYVAEGLMMPYGLQIDTAASGFEAIEKIESGSLYDIVFMDHMMPKMDGIEAAGIIRGLGYSHPIVALTANAMVGQSDIFLQNGFDAFISKPIDMRNLNSVLNKYVRDKQPAEVIEAARRQSSAKNGQSYKQPSHTLIGEIEGLDMAKGLARYDGNADTYLRILRSYTASVRSMLGTIEVFDASRLKDYEITVHGIKGSSFDIYADAVAESAKALEMAAKAGDIDYITLNNPAFLETARKLVRSAEDMLSAISADITKPSKDIPDEKALKKLLAACRIYDMEAADEAMEELEMYQYTSDDGLTGWLRDSVDLIDFTSIAEKLSYLDN